MLVFWLVVSAVLVLSLAKRWLSIESNEKEVSTMESEDIANGNSKENKSSAVNFILGGENDPEIVIEEVPDEYHREDENREEKEDSFPQGLKTPNSFESRSANSSYANMFGLSERKKRLRFVSPSSDPHLHPASHPSPVPTTSSDNTAAAEDRTVESNPSKTGSRDQNRPNGKIQSLD